MLTIGNEELRNLEEQVEKNKDDILFTILSTRVETLEEKISELETYVSTITDNKEKIENLDSEVQYLKNNVVYALSEV